MSESGGVPDLREENAIGAVSSTSNTPDAPDTSAASEAIPESESVPVVPVDALSPAGVNLPTALSPSRASDFMTCPLLYRFRVIDKLPERKSPAAARGTLVHAALERLFDLPAGQRTPPAASAILEPEWQRMVEQDPELKGLSDDAKGGPEGWLAGAVELLGRYFRLEDPNRLEPAERELYVQARIDGRGDAPALLLRGYVDRLDVAPDGAIRIVDYKTGRSPGPLFENKALFQMKFYALVLWKMRGIIPKRLQLMYLGDTQVVTYDPDEGDLRATERKVVALWSAIQSAAEKGQWQPHPTKLCDWCDHKALCPAYGGTPPPLPQVTLVEAREGNSRSEKARDAAEAP